MSIDAYTPCPGGTGKKIKFCCPDFLGELQSIERMLDGEQYVGCLTHVEKLLATHPDKACLLAWRCTLLRSLQRSEAFKAAVADFLARHPSNSIALAEQAILAAAEGDPRGALEPMQAAIAGGGESLPVQVYESMWAVTAELLADGSVMAARAWLATLLVVNPEDPRPADMLVRLDSSPQLPLWVKDGRRPDEAPADAPWKARFEDALAPLRHLQWSEGMRRMAQLAQEWPGEPQVVRTLATLQTWLAYEAEAADSLRRYAALDVPLEDAVEATALAMFLSGDPLGDEEPVWELSYDVGDPDALSESLAGSRQLIRTPVDTARWPSEEGPPPMGVFALLDRPSADAPDTPLAELPRVLGQLLLFGRQTDRSARLELVQLLDGDRPAAQTLLVQLGGTALGDLVAEAQEGRSPKTRELLAPHWRLPPGITREQLRRLADEHQEDVVYRRWPALPLGCLGGRTPQEAAADPAAKVAVLAAVMYFEFYARGVGIRPDMNRLRAQLGLPELGLVDTTVTPLRQVPLVRRHRIDPAKLADADLIEGFRSAVVNAATDAADRFGRELVERPSMENNPERLEAYSWLIQSTTDAPQALAWIERARQEIDRKGVSNAMIDLWELSLHFRRADGAGASRVMEHIQSRHIREPGVASALQSLLVQAGLLRPDGMPTAAASRAAAAAMGVQPPIPPADEPQPGELWVPDGAKPAAGEKSKLWVPGMD